MTGYIDYSVIQEQRLKARERLLSYYESRRLDPGFFVPKASELTPVDWTSDPYFLCLLLGLAQHQYYADHDRKSQSRYDRLYYKAGSYRLPILHATN